MWSIYIDKIHSSCDSPLSLPLSRAVFCAHFCDSYFLHNMLSWTPTYFHETFPHMQNNVRKVWEWEIVVWEWDIVVWEWEVVVWEWDIVVWE